MINLGTSLPLVRLVVSGALALAIFAALATGPAVAGESYPAIGPLPARDAPKASLVAMGKRLFFDARISGDGAIACAACHDPAKGFGDGMALSNAYPGTKYFRNAPTLINTVYKSAYANVGWAWDGHMGANLNDVVRDQITETTIMNMDMRIMHERMKQDAVYVEMCQENFGGECSSGKARKALVAFIETLVSGNNTAFDKGELSVAATRGRTLFEGKANCIQCHNGSYFSDGAPHNTGVPENLEIFRDPIRHLTYRSVIATHGVPKMEIWRRDVGYFLVSKNYADVGKFVTPTLRELVYTGPYMHNGVFNTLEEVVYFYNLGGGHDDPLASEIEPLGLIAGEQADLVAFLESLSGSEPVTVEPLVVPQKYEPIDDWLETQN
jgi:cytochrome c peroxidase